MEILSFIISLVISVLVLFFCAWLFEKFIVPIIPPKWGKWIAAGLAMIIILWLLGEFFGLRF